MVAAEISTSAQYPAVKVAPLIKIPATIRCGRTRRALAQPPKVPEKNVKGSSMSPANVKRAARKVIGDMSGSPARVAMKAPLQRKTNSNGKIIFAIN